jgi:hypothetical protein
LAPNAAVKAEAIVFLDYSKDFSHMRQGGFAALAKVLPRISWRCSREKMLRRHGAVPR